MEVYKNLVRSVLINGSFKENRTGIFTISKFSEHYKFDLANGFPLLTTKKMDGYRWNSLIHEFLWYLSGEDHIRNLAKKTKIWDAWADENGNLQTAYGRYWRRFPSAEINPETNKYEVKEVDQIADVIKLLKTNPNSRRMVVSAWEPGNALNSKLPPCHFTYVFNVQGNKLNIHLTQRSGDVALGIPFNVACYSMFDIAMAQLTDFEIGFFSHDIVDAHIYCGKGKRAEFYRENHSKLKQKLVEVERLSDYLNIKRWIELNAPEEDKSEEDKDHVPGLLEQLSREIKPLPNLIVAKKSLDELAFEDFKLVDYNPHPPIKFAVAV